MSIEDDTHREDMLGTVYTDRFGLWKVRNTDSGSWVRIGHSFTQEHIRKITGTGLVTDRAGLDPGYSRSLDVKSNTTQMLQFSA